MTAESRKIDDLDRSIVERLRVNGRESNRSLASALSVNEATIAARLRRLEADRVMHVVALTDMAGFGYEFLAFVFIKVAGRPVLEVAEDLSDVAPLISVNVVTGHYDIVCAALVADSRQLGDVIDETIAAVPGVQALRCEMAIDVLRFSSEWASLAAGSLTDRPRPPLPTGAAGDLDLQIIKILQEDARTSNRSIAAQLEVSEGTVRVRLKRLEEQHLIRIRAVSDIGAFDLRAAALVGVHTRPGDVAGLGEELAAIDGVAAVIRTIGEFSYLLIVIAETREELLGLVLQRIQGLAGTTSTESFEVAGTTKHVYTWVRLLDDATEIAERAT